MMKTKFFLCAIMVAMIGMTSCVSKKKFTALQSELDTCNEELAKCGEDLTRFKNDYETCMNDKKKLQSDYDGLQSKATMQEQQMTTLQEQVSDLRKMRDVQIKQISDLTDLSTTTTANITKTLEQLKEKEEHLKLLQAAKTKADSINLALAVNLKGVLNDGIMDDEIEVKVDKTVVFVNLSDKMTFNTASDVITPKARGVLGKIAKIIESRPDLEVMVEGYTDNRKIRNECIDDNWDLSVKRATSVVRVLEREYNVDPNKLIAAGRGEHNILATNETAEGRAMNRRTRIILLPKVDQFYELLDPAKAGK